MEQNTVFISYRRSLSRHLARSIYMDLRAHGWDVFLDVNTLDNGDFDRIILNQIAARAHFILIISPDSLMRYANEGDWVLREIEEAVRLERNIVPIIEEGANFERELSYLPPQLRAIISKKSGLPLVHFFFEAAVDMLRSRFLKIPVYVPITATPPEERTEVLRRIAAVEAAPPLETPAPTRPRTPDLLPAPFAWIDIPGSKSKKWKDKPYKIAKYPVTNAQFRVFIEAGGYRETQWWTADGWQAREQKKWTQPRFWKEARWNGADHPVVGVSWYEAVAFCLWLTDKTGEQVMLLTEDQWQFAAQGDEGRVYPWGDAWDAPRCNHKQESVNFGKTTPVQQFAGQDGHLIGESAYGVADMAGIVVRSNK